MIEHAKSVFLQNIIGNSEKCSDLDIKRYEKLIDHKLPDDYRRFLLDYNGGSLTNTLIFSLATNDRITHESIRRFYGFGKGMIWDLEDQYKPYHFEQNRMMRGMIPIGMDLLGNNICLMVTRKEFGRVYFWGHDDEVDFDDEDDCENPYRNCSLIADSFRSFLEKLQEQSEESP